MLSSSHLLLHYDEKKKLIHSCDTSSYGLGAVLSHVMDDGSKKPIVFASQTLGPAQKNIHNSTKKL